MVGKRVESVIYSYHFPRYSRPSSSGRRPLITVAVILAALYLFHTHLRREGIFKKRDEWRRVASGWEGEVFVYDDDDDESVAIKSFFTKRSPLRNCLPSGGGGSGGVERIPTEIPATVLLGGLTADVGGGGGIHEETDFMPVNDFFFDRTSSNWYLLTPFLPAGNLKDVAKQHLRPRGLTTRELDERFRPSLNRLLDALDRIHGRFGLCHDDIKPANIFVAGGDEKEKNDFTHWILADFGNVRQVEHPYHKTLIWTRDSRQLEDCRLNDAVRLVKTYITFLRLSSSSLSSFDDGFWDGKESWSRLYWSAVRDPLVGNTAANMLREKSLSLPPASTDTTSAGKMGFTRGDTEEELNRGMWVSEDRAKAFAATSLLGVPRSRC
ncbi:hypothetical protein GGS20DRAFT_578595 [Poronia punctata]|nr:hypothetical protein GGS20DRAFT_578595 [Poronia punctata]